MSETTLNIIIGALIGFIPSALIAFVAHLLQLGEKRKERERQIVENRLNQVENHATKVMSFINTSYLTLNDKDSEFIKKPVVLYDFMVYKSIANNLDDIEIVGLYNRFYEEFQKYISILMDILNSTSKDSKKKDELLAQVEASRITYEKLIARIDYLRKKL